MNQAVQQEDLTRNEAVTPEEPEKEGVEVEDNRNYEAEARDMGWVPREEYRGKEENWRDAEDFVKRGETILPIVTAQNKKLRSEMEKREVDWQQRLDRLERANTAAVEAQKKQHESELTRIKEEQRIAAETGDFERYDSLDKQRDDLVKNPPGGETTSDPQAAWVAKNPWYQTDFELNQTALQYSQFIGQNNPNMTLEDNLRQTEEFIKQKYPEKFGQPSLNGTAKQQHATVDGGSQLPPPPKKRGNVFRDLPAEAQEACKRFVAEGLVTEEEYIKDYFNE